MEVGKDLGVQAWFQSWDLGNKKKIGSSKLKEIALFGQTRSMRVKIF